MYFMFLKIIDIDYKDDIFLALESVEIDKASYVEGNNLDSILRDEMPIFKGFFKTEEDKSKKVILITALVKEKKQIDDFINILKEADIDIENDDIIRVVAWKVDYIFDKIEKS
ncbi:hypothetical protein [Haliovirga abyssi]|uniref:DUF3240 domain-containing protein n=1 Tax=Haliovirga abyssi TaxID=2996794 RepID=A0AAU9DIM8_9FUSO|nr:hypothetical protein [Haliovirga abyssi]BDU51457.1 hypothetical protein HLVA_20260 [Haliovirga abyssi]